jgi:microcystin synthetase protein McyJ
MWLNLGYWETATSYPDAANALASKTALYSRLKNRSIVVDVGCGFGESLLLWRSRFDAHPESVGINLSGAESDIARKRGVSVRKS